METRPDLGIVICTFNRRREVLALLKKICEEYDFEVKVVVVDSSDSEYAISCEVIDQKGIRNSKIVIEIITTKLRSLPAQKEIGTNHALKEPALKQIMYLDDDTYLEPESAKEIQNLFLLDSDLVAVSGVTTNQLPKINAFHNWFRKTFLLTSSREGVLLSSGVNIPVRTLSQQLVLTDWLIGCSSWRVTAAKELTFPSNLPGSALYEDVILSQSGRKMGKIAVAPWIHLKHDLSEVNRPDSYLHGRRNQRNRYELTKIPISGVTKFGFWWATIGFVVESAVMILVNLLKGRRQRVAQNWKFIKGTFRGSWDVLFSRTPA